MNRFTKVLGGFAVAAGALFVAANASAHGYWGGPRVGIVVGVPFPWYDPWYYPPAYAYEPPPVIVAAPAAPAAAPAQSYYWYYCADSKMYYPYAKECPSGWQQVTPQPQQAPQAAPSAPAH